MLHDTNINRYILNTPVLTNYGTFRFERIDIGQARELARNAVSAVGHQGAADALSELLGMPVPLSRTEINMNMGDVALVFRLLPRLPEGAVLSAADTIKLPHEFGRLERIA